MVSHLFTFFVFLDQYALIWRNALQSFISGIYLLDFKFCFAGYRVQITGDFVVTGDILDDGCLTKML